MCVCVCSKVLFPNTIINYSILIISYLINK